MLAFDDTIVYKDASNAAHTVGSKWTDSVGDHTHAVTINTSYADSHTHPLMLTTGSTGSTDNLVKTIAWPMFIKY